MYAVRRRGFTDVVRRLITVDRLPQVKVLDVGSGTGFFLDAWLRQGVRDLTGSDLTPTAVERLSSRFPSCPIYQVDIGSPALDLSDDSFDVVSIMDVLYHIVDDDRYGQAIRNLARLLKPGGLLIMSENLADEEQRTSHQVTRRRTDISRVLTEAGFQLALSRPMFFLMDAPTDTRRRFHQTWWRLISMVARRGEALGWLVGAILASVDLLLGRVRRTGPSTEFLAFRLRET
jgi:2-polyprenyl-3-methyl-5-hydroxy-6-metoxy-1,4-benzoquinol methylase